MNSNLKKTSVEYTTKNLCETCGLVFYRNTAWRDTWNNCVYDFACKVCDYTFIMNSNLTNHFGWMRSKRFMWNLWFSILQKYCMKRHMGHLHLWLCMFCMWLNIYSELKSSKKFWCKTCGLSFYRNTAWRET